MRADDPRHGTVRGYSAHRRAKEPTCQPCRDAIAKRCQTLILTGSTLTPAHGTKLRIQALSTLGYTFAEIAQAAGWAKRSNISSIFAGTRVTHHTRDRVAAAYDRLSMVLPDEDQAHRNLTRARAAAKGWLPPLALDDDRIDDPTYRPTKHLSKAEREQLRAAGVRNDFDHAVVERVLSGAPRPRPLTHAEAAEVCRRLLHAGHTSTEIENRWGIKPDRYTHQDPRRGVLDPRHDGTAGCRSGRGSRPAAGHPPRPRWRRRMSRQQKTPRQRAEEQLSVASRLVTRLEKKRDELETDLKVIRTELAAQTRRRNYLAAHPDLPQQPTSTSASSTTSTGATE